MASAPFTAAADLCAAFTALELYSFLNPQSGAGTTTSTQDSAFDGAAQVLLTLAATMALFAAVASIYRHLNHAAAAGAGAANRRLSELATFIICAAVGILEFFLFVQPSGGEDGGSAQARALGMAAVGALPAAATVTFFLGMTFIIAHIRAGGEGGGGGGAVAVNRRVPAPVGLLQKMALGAAAALLTQMAMALYATTG